MRSMKKIAAVSLAVPILLAAAACGGGGSGGSSSDALSKNLTGRGPITYVQGKDNSKVAQPIVDKWNAAHPNEKATLKEQTDQADQQHDDLVQHLQSKSSDYDVMSVDLIWVNEFAARGWLQPLTGALAPDTSGLLPATVKASTYKDKLYAAPQTTDGGILYYRKDLVKTPPKTWDEVWQDCAIAKQNNVGCYAGQFSKYEGLTVNVAEFINTFGGQIVNEQGEATVDSDAAKKGLGQIIDHFKNGDIPKQASTYTEENGRAAFEAGKLLFYRNWPYGYNLALTDGASKVKNSFGIAPLPGATADKAGASSLGGHNNAISAYSKHKATAADFLKFVESPEIQKFYVTQASAAPVLASLYTDAELIKQKPYLPVLKASLDNAVPRPVTPFYTQVSVAIQDNATAAINGKKSADQAITDMQAAIKAAG